MVRGILYSISKENGARRVSSYHNRLRGLWGSTAICRLADMGDYPLHSLALFIGIAVLAAEVRSPVCCRLVAFETDPRLVAVTTPRRLDRTALPINRTLLVGTAKDRKGTITQRRRDARSPSKELQRPRLLATIGHDSYCRVVPYHFGSGFRFSLACGVFVWARPLSRPFNFESQH